MPRTRHSLLLLPHANKRHLLRNASEGKSVSMRSSFPIAASLLFGLVTTATPTERDLPSALGVPRPGPTNDAAYAPQPIVQGGVIVPLYPPDSPLLKKERVREAEQYNLSKAAPGRINSIVNIHNPSIEVHTVEGGLNTGAAIILAAGGGHKTLNVGSESAEYRHPSQSAPQRRLQRAGRRGQ
jgi:hypothetical protein